MTERIVPEALPPGEVIKAELEARGWKQADLAHIMGVSDKVVHDLISGKRKINVRLTQLLADAFGSLAEEWAKLQYLYDRTVESLTNDDSIRRRRNLYEVVPLREIILRGWIEKSESVEFLEAETLHFYSAKTISEISAFAAAARKSTDYSEQITPSQLAWLWRCKHLAESLAISKKYDPRSFNKLLQELRGLRIDPVDVLEVPKVLEKFGIRFLIVEHLPGSKIDGVTFWLDGKEPVIALSMRYDRIDWFWFTLLHELGHVKHGHGKAQPTLDTLLVGDNAQDSNSKPDEEQIADRFAAQELIDDQQMQKFIDTVKPMYSNSAIRGFARIQKVHPGIIVGRLQYLHKIAYNRGREMLVKVRDTITQSAITDGWGHSISI